jgi:hypothetical protein
VGAEECEVVVVVGLEVTEEAVMEHHEAVASEVVFEEVAVGATRRTKARDYKSGH